MLKIYEKKYSYNSNARDREKLESLKRLGVLYESVQGIVPALPRLHPTKEAQEKLLPSYKWTETGISTVNPAGRNISPIANIAKNTAIPKILSTSRIPMNGGAGVVPNVMHTNVPTAGTG